MDNDALQQWWEWVEDNGIWVFKQSFTQPKSDPDTTISSVIVHFYIYTQMAV